MNIAHLLPYSARFPLAKHHGRYEWALRLAKYQVKRGHQVTIYAAPGSSDPESTIVWHSQPNDQGDKLLNNTSLLEAAFNSPDHDIYHSHFDWLHYRSADLTDKPVVVTQHWMPDQAVAQAVSANTKGNVYTVPPTNFLRQADQRLGIPVVETIYHGINLELFKPSDGPVSDRLIFVGRISPRKGVRQAVEIARENNQPLDIVGKVEAADQAYWESILPLVDGQQIRFLGPKSLAETAALMAQAKAMLFPSQAPEAFGQVTVEAQACGTPVIINDTGPSRELVDHGRSGFVVTTPAEYKTALAGIDSISRQDCHDFAQKFDINAMVDHYEALYARLI